jgi:hypothetical protein
MLGTVVMARTMEFAPIYFTAAPQTQALFEVPVMVLLLKLLHHFIVIFVLPVYAAYHPRRLESST